MGEFEASLGGGFIANIEYASPLENTPQGANVTEIDLSLIYGTAFQGFEFEVGFMYSSFLNKASANTGEVIAAAGYGAVKVTYYYAFMGNPDSWKKDQYIDLALNTELVTIDWTANFGFYLPSKDAANPTGFPTNKNELGHIDLSASKSFHASDLSITPSIRLSIPTYSGKPSNSNQLVLGFALGF